MNKVTLLLDPQRVEGSEEQIDSIPFDAVLEAVTDGGYLLVRDSSSNQYVCDWLEATDGARVALNVGDRLLVLRLRADQHSVVLGRIGRYRELTPAQHVSVEATESISMKCGDASIDLRADGKVLIRGDDIVVRAKGTKRIRAGTVSIN